MKQFRDALFELGTEELPPKSLPLLSRTLRQSIEAGLSKVGLVHSGVEAYASPRRLAIRVRDLEEVQSDQVVERRGPALGAAYREDGAPTPAMEGFLRGAGATLDQVTTLETDKGAWVIVRQQVQGQPATKLFPDIVRQALDSLPIAKRMRWGSGAAEFVRPVHWVVLLFGEEVVPREILGKVAGRVTQGHRFHAKGPITIPSPADYVDLLEREGFVLANFEQRRERIRLQAEDVARNLGGIALIDEDLLDEVTSLVEWPVPVIGSIEARFLELPAEVLITTLKANQKYFPVQGVEGGLLPFFITFSNLDSTRPETVREGNERVVRPRLADAEFFWNLDLKRSLESRVEDLRQVTFQQRLGSLYDKSVRVERLAEAMAASLALDETLVGRAARLAKTDLLTSMVGEFPELQGTMGRHYALQQGENPAVAIAIEEQYFPKGAGGELPHTDMGRVLALAEKIDTLCGIFCVGLIPSGDKDPYALRRAAIGILRICIEGRMDLDLGRWVGEALSFMPNEFELASTRERIVDFIQERLKGYVTERGFRPDEFEAVAVVAAPNPLDFERRLSAVRAFRLQPEAASLAAANKRIRNLLRKSGTPSKLPDDSSLTDPLERALKSAVDEAHALTLPLLALQDYSGVLGHLAALRQPVDDFFEGVMVMAEDPKVRDVRIGLLSEIEQLFLGIADFSKLQD